MFLDIESDFYAALLTAVALLAVLNPFGNLTQFLAMTEGLVVDMRQKLFRSIVYTACAIVLIFLLSGPYIMQYMFRVGLDDLRIGGGLILIIMAIKNLLFPASMAVIDFSQYQNLSKNELLKKSIIPMAFPMLVGPGTLSTVVIIAGDKGMFVTICGVIIVFIFMFILFHFSAMIERILGKLALHIVSRIVQVFIVAMGAKMIITGIKNIFP